MPPNLVKRTLAAFLVILLPVVLTSSTQGSPTTTSVEIPKFLTLPFSDPAVKLYQGWLYDFQPNKHEGIDYIKGTSGDSTTWQEFRVLAAASGWATYVPDHATWGNYVRIEHKIGSELFYTLYAHFSSSPLLPNKPTYVYRGEYIGTAGSTGEVKCTTRSACIHLHLEFSSGGYGPGHRLDPYDIKNINTYYPGGALYAGVGESTSWLTTPPEFGGPVSLYPEAHYGIGVCCEPPFTSWPVWGQGPVNLDSADNVVSSIKLPDWMIKDGWYVIAYEGPNQTGGQKIFAQSDPDFSNDFYDGTVLTVDNTISSLAIYNPDCRLSPQSVSATQLGSMSGLVPQCTPPTPQPTPTATQIPNGSVPTVTPAPGLPADTWYVDYFNDLNLNGSACQGGTTTLFPDKRAFVFKDWADNSPSTGCNSNFAARIWRQFDFQSGTYNFHLFADDKARLYVDGTLVVDQWVGTAHNESRNLAAGRHEIKVEFQDSGGAAWLNAWWDGPGYPPPPHESKDPDQWFGAFWQGTNWRGDAFMTFNDGNPLPLNKDWTHAGPGFGLADNDFSTKYERTYRFDCGDYLFTLDADDLAELSVVDADTGTAVHRLEVTRANNQVQSPSAVHLLGKNYQIQVSHREFGGGARLFVDWSQVSACPLPPKDAGSLPWQCGTQVGVVQNRQNTGDTHAPGSVDQWAWDFNNPSATLWEIYAARDGVIAEVETGYATGSGCSSPLCADSVNYVVVDHGDGTAGLYSHLAQELPRRLRVGDRVRAGVTLIGRADTTGQTTGQQLHYAVQSWSGPGDWRRPSIEALFSDPNVPTGNPLQPNFYISGNCPPVNSTTLSLSLGAILHDRPIDVVIRRPATETDPAVSVFNMTGQADANGNLVLTVPRLDTGVYQLYLKPRGYVRKLLDNTYLANGQDNPFVLDSLFTKSCNGHVCGGDGNGDNVVNIMDFTMLSLDFNTTNARSDFNGDNIVNVLDYTMLAMGFGTRGDGDDIAATNPANLATAVAGNGSLALGISGQAGALQADATAQSVPLVSVGEEFTVTLTYDSGGAATNGIDALVDYDPCLFQPVPERTLVSAPFENRVTAVGDADSEISVYNRSAPPVSGSGVLAYFVYKAVASSPNLTTFSVRFQPSKTQDSNIAEAATGAEILGSVTNLVVQTVGAPVMPSPAVTITQPAMYGSEADMLVSATVDDACARTRQVTFSALTSSGNWQVIGADINGSNGWRTQWAAGSVPDQVVQVKAYARDRAGNGVESAPHYVELDRTPPHVNGVTFTPVQAFAGDTVSIAAEISDPGSGFSRARVYIDPSIDGSAPWTLWKYVDTITPQQTTALWNTSEIAPGRHLVRLMVRDRAGNETIWPAANQEPLSITLLRKPVAISPVPTATPVGGASLWLSYIRNK